MALFLIREIFINILKKRTTKKINNRHITLENMEALKIYWQSGRRHRGKITLHRSNGFELH